MKVANQQKADRAKLFLPFDALKGFREALAEKERIVVPKTELSEDRKEELDRLLHQIKPGDIITVVYFHNEEYVQLTGMLSRISLSGRTLSIVQTRISFADIYSIEEPF
ncbi:YolD-like family protein [Eisenbergiella sp. OF01-20]|nr:YolD-like family protein [Lachnospiraceae bacterium]RHP89191.1 YolD-like family protein [Eisenbergiella sp. OF01-20]